GRRFRRAQRLSGRLWAQTVAAPASARRLGRALETLSHDSGVVPVACARAETRRHPAATGAAHTPAAHPQTPARQQPYARSETIAAQQGQCFEPAGQARSQGRRYFFSSASTIGCTKALTSPPNTAISRTSVEEMKENGSCGVRNTVSKLRSRWRDILA